MYSIKRYDEDNFVTVYMPRTIASDDKQSRYDNSSKGIEKFDCSIVRASNMIFEYSYCNDFDYFAHLTLDEKKYDRYNLEKFQSDMSRFIRNYRIKHNVKLEYLLVPERHQDFAWHMHGLFKGEIKDLFKNKNGYLDWKAYSDKFGWISLDKVRSREAVSKYIRKYISKDFAKSITDLGAHLYYVSRGLKRAEIVESGIVDIIPTDTHFNNDYCIKYFSDTKPALNNLDADPPELTFDQMTDLYLWELEQENDRGASLSISVQQEGQARNRAQEYLEQIRLEKV